jgi:putative transposase
VDLSLALAVKNSSVARSATSGGMAAPGSLTRSPLLPCGRVPPRGTRPIDERVNAFLTRPLEGEWPYVWIDATYVKAREAGRIVSTATIIAVGVNTDGRREVLGVATGPSEAEAFWKSFLRSLADRGLRGVRLVIADDHKGLRAAASKVFHATLQRCRVHWMRNAMAHVAAKQRPAVMAMIKTIFAQETAAEAHAQWKSVADALRERAPRLAELMDEAREDVLAYTAFPKEHWPQIASTNPLERLNGEVKRRSNVVGIFPNDRAVAPPTMLQGSSGKLCCDVILCTHTMARVFGSAC